jgi:glycerol-3-phosphate dehydrogenase
MSDIRPCIAILGGGIHGTAIAALFAQSSCCEVTLFERDRIASGITSTNHGRLHVGTRIWRSRYDTVAWRRRLGAELVRQLPGVVREQEQGLCLIEAAEDIEPFENVCQRWLISCKRVGSSVLNENWVRGSRFAAIYEVPEYSFNPARLAGSLAAYASSLGAEILTGSPVQAVEVGASGKFLIRLSNGDTFETDLIVNALGNWANQVRSELSLPQLNLQWHRRRLLCLFVPSTSSNLVLNRVITIFDKDNQVPGAIPHNPWIVFGSDVNIESLQAPDDGDIEKWQTFDKNRPMDHLLFELHARYFLPLQSLETQEISQRLFSVSGVYPYLDGHKVSDFQIHQSDKVPRYYLISGGNATTALLDARDLVEVVLKQLDLPHRWTTDQTVQLIRSLMIGFRQEVYPDSIGMIWEDRTDGLVSALGVRQAISEVPAERDASNVSLLEDA